MVVQPRVVLVGVRLEGRAVDVNVDAVRRRVAFEDGIVDSVSYAEDGPECSFHSSWDYIAAFVYLESVVMEVAAASYDLEVGRD